MDNFTAAFLIIGNEILSGRTVEKNLPVLARMLNQRGWRLAEARVVADVAADIGAAVCALRRRYSVVLTSGGIGSTHDDITTDSIAAALELPVAEHPQAVQILTEFYAERGAPFTEARRRMARAPQGAEILRSAFPGAPAYRIENIIVCAGVPDIFNMMADAAVAALPQGVVQTSQVLRVFCGETVFADDLAQVAAAFTDVNIGSYPREENDVYVCQIVFTGSENDRITAAKNMFCEYLNREQLPFELL